MDNENMINEVEVPEVNAPEVEDIPLPEGYAEGDDLFKPETWTGTKKEEPAADPTEEDAPDFFEANKDAGGVSEPQEQPAGEEKTEDAGKAEEPEKAAPAAAEQPSAAKAEPQRNPAQEQELNALRAQLQHLQGVIGGFDAMSKNMGYENAQTMFTKAKESYRDAEIKRLVSEGMHEEAAKDLVERRMSATKPAQTVQQASAPAAGTPRNFMREMNDLLGDYPGLRDELDKGGKLPQEVITEAVKSNIPLRVAYARHEAKQVRSEMEAARKELEALRKENEIFKQNAASAAKGPVKAATSGGKADTKANDPFLKGFYSED